MRVYFHLRKETETIRDENGVEVRDVDGARAEALNTILEMRIAGDQEPADWAGWKLEVVDASGAVLFSLDLDAPV